MSTIWAFEHIENDPREDCIKRFCESFGKHAKKIDFEKIKMLPLTKKK